MFRRATLTAVVVVIVALGSVGGATAGSGAQVTQDRFHGPFAEAGWEASTPTSITDAAILASQEQDGTTHLSIFDLHTTYLDTSGNVTGSLDVTGELNAGASFTLDKINLTTASASGTVPVTRCTFDAAGNPTGCTNDTMAVGAREARHAEDVRLERRPVEQLLDSRPPPRRRKLRRENRLPCVREFGTGRVD